MEHERHSDRTTEIEDQYAGYEVYDHNGEKIGKVDDLFVDDNDRPEYIGVKTGFPGAGSPLIPMRAVRVDERRRVVEIPLPKGRVGEGPSYYDDQKNNARLRAAGAPLLRRSAGCARRPRRARLSCGPPWRGRRAPFPIFWAYAAEHDGWGKGSGGRPPGAYHWGCR